MRMPRIPPCVVVGVLTLWAAPAAVARPTVNLEPVADNTMYSENSILSNGAGQYFFVGKTANGYTRRALVRFDLSSIPPSATITSATLTMSMSRTQAAANNVSLHRATSSWGEGGSNAASEEGNGAAAQANDATWTNRFHPGTPWTSPGGDFAASPSATQSVGGIGTYSWTGAGLLSDVVGWYSSPSSNLGWVIVGTEAGVKTAKRFNAREFNAPSQRPILSVTYTTPTTPGRCCLPDGSCVVTTFDGCAGQGGTFGGVSTTCASCTCPGPVGACCLANGTCVTVNWCSCASSGGVFKGVGVSCAGVYCSPQLQPYMDPLPIPPVLTPTTVFPDHDYYEVTIREVLHQSHSQLQANRVWGYNGLFPGPSFKVQKGRPARVKWINDLRNTYADEPPFPLRTQHILPVDTCLHGVNPLDLRPRTVTHLHGGVVDQESDGPPEGAFPPGASSPDYWYPNRQRAATLWYHDHALGLTRLNVYMGLAGFYLIHDPAEDALQLPSGEYDIPLCIQDRSFNADGSFRYTGTAGAQEEFFGDKMLVNGKVWPYLTVAQTKYRFRLLNGCNSRTLTLSLVPTGNFQAPWWQVATEQGLMSAPLQLGPLGPGSITLQPGERADVVIDFSGVPGLSGVYLRNTAPAPYPGTPGVGVVNNVMLFGAGFAPVFSPPLPATLATVPALPVGDAADVKEFRLKTAGQLMCNHSTWLINNLMWDDITDVVRVGTTEVWKFVNQSAVTHPMHLHLAAFQVLDRQAFTTVNGNPVPGGPLFPPSPSELGWKDTVQCPPNQITRVIARFDDFSGIFPYHCHLLEHEDHEMMRQYQVLCDPAAILGNTADVEVNLGETAHFVVLAMGDANRYQWYKGAAVLHDGVTPGGSVISGATTDHLVITNAQVTHTYTDEHACYRCVVTNPCSVAQQSSCIALHIFGECQGDLNGDLTVNTADLVILLGAFGQSVPPGTSGDMDGNGVVNTADLVVLLGRFGQGC